MTEQTKDLAGVIADYADTAAEGFKALGERVDAIAKDVDQLVTRAARPGGASRKARRKVADTPGVTMLGGKTLKSRDAIARELNITPADSPVQLKDFLQAVAGVRVPDHVKTLVTGTDASGGYATPNTLLPDILAALAPESSLLTAGARVAVLDTLVGKQFRVAGINALPTAAWRAEAGTVATSEPTFRAIDLVPRSLAFQFKVSRELLADAPNINDALTIAIAQAFAKELDRAGLRGTGTAPEIRGILNTVGIQAVTNGANGASLATTAYANFISALTAIMTADAPRPTAAIMAPRSYGVLAGLLDTANQPRQVPAALATWPMISTSAIPVNLTVGSSSDCSEIYCGSWNNFVFYLKEPPSFRPVDQLYAGTGEIGFICHARVDVACLYPQAFAVVTGVRP